jgi:hypothetical protein
MNGEACKREKIRRLTTKRTDLAQKGEMLDVAQQNGVPIYSKVPPLHIVATDGTYSARA